MMLMDFEMKCYCLKFAFMLTLCSLSLSDSSFGRMISNVLCSFIDNCLQIALHIPGSNNLSMHLPIVVGTVPYRPPIARPLNDGICGLHYLPVVPPPYRENPTPPPPIEG